MPELSTDRATRRASASNGRRAGIAAAALFFWTASWTACGGKEEVAVETAPIPLPVKMFTLGEGESGNAVEYPGRIQAWLHSEMAFEVSGKITEFRVVEGDRVRKGDILVRLDPRDFEADLQKARAVLAQAKADKERYEKLFAEGVASQAELDARTEHFGVSQADVTRALKALEDADLVAPFDGMVARKLVEDFENVMAKKPVLILQDVHRLKIRTAVPESDLAGRGPARSRENINQRIQAEVSVSSLPGERFPAELGELALTADPTTRTFDATFYFDPPPGVHILPGMTAKVSLRLSEPGEQAHAVPGSAVWSDEAGNPQVWRVDPETSTVRRTPVELGAMSGSRVEIRGGLEAGDVVVTSGVHQLEEGRLVRRYVR